MARHKPRLLLGLYARPKHPGTYHYALFITPRIKSPGKRLAASKYHVKNTIQIIDDQVSQPWQLEQFSTPDISHDPRLLICVVIGKIVSLDMVEKLISQTPVYQVDHPDVEKARSFDCLSWVRDALDRVRLSGAVSSLSDWETIYKGALEYVDSKKKEGRWDAGRACDDAHRIPVLDLLTGCELVS